MNTNIDVKNRSYRVFTDPDLCLCENWPYRWPGWVGGNVDFLKQEQPFHLIEDLIDTTMLEF